MPNKNSQKSSRFSNYGILLTGKKTLRPPSSIVEEKRSRFDAGIGFDAGKNRGFGAGENDWLGAEAYVDPVR